MKLWFVWSGTLGVINIFIHSRLFLFKYKELGGSIIFYAGQNTASAETGHWATIGAEMSSAQSLEFWKKDFCESLGDGLCVQFPPSTIRESLRDQNPISRYHKSSIGCGLDLNSFKRRSHWINLWLVPNSDPLRASEVGLWRLSLGSVEDGIELDMVGSKPS